MATPTTPRVVCALAAAAVTSLIGASQLVLATHYQATQAAAAAAAPAHTQALAPRAGRRG